MKSLPDETGLAMKSKFELEYRLTSGVLHSSVSVINQVRAMFHHSDPVIVGAALFHPLTSLVHGYAQAAWAVGSRTLVGTKREQLRAVLVELYEVWSAEKDLYRYLTE